MVARRKTPASAPAPDAASATHVRADPVYLVRAQLFRVLGHPVRIRILELLSDGERTVGELQAQLDLDSSGTSQHLAALRQEGLVGGRREGRSIYYAVKDPLVSELLALARQILTARLSDSAALLSHLANESAPRAAAKPPR